MDGLTTANMFNMVNMVKGVEKAKPLKPLTYMYFPANTRRWINVGLTLVQRRRRWTNVKPTLIQRLVSAASLSFNALVF